MHNLLDLSAPVINNFIYSEIAKKKYILTSIYYSHVLSSKMAFLYQSQRIDDIFTCSNVEVVVECYNRLL